jgi:hypothetical protein
LPNQQPPSAHRSYKPNPFKWFKTSPEIIRLAVMLYVRFPLSLCNFEDLLHERGVDVSQETVRFWGHRFGPMFVVVIRQRRTGTGKPKVRVASRLRLVGEACLTGSNLRLSLTEPIGRPTWATDRICL